MSMPASPQGSAAPASPKAPVAPAAPTAPNALSPGAQQAVQPGQTPCQQAQTLNSKQMSVDAVKSMANGLPEHSAVKWASASASKVANPAHGPDSQALSAAHAWTQNPTPANQQAAALAASKTDHKTPGAWAAQAAAWSGKGGGLTQHAVSGSVLLAAAQGGKPISAPGAAAPSVAAPQATAPTVAAPAKPKAPSFQMPFFKKPAAPTAPTAPDAHAPSPPPGPDGHCLTPQQRAEMAKNCDPYLKLGCDIGQGKA
jgi:hypothetical protein